MNQFVRLLLVFAFLIEGQAIAAPAFKPPNIVFILADQWRAQALGYAGDPNVHTPHLDALERRSLNFTNAVAGMPVCCPTRASLITGQRPLTHGVFLNDVPLNPNARSIAKSFSQAGYDTGYIGKWHLNGDGRSAFIPPERRQGFNYWKVLECTHSYNHSFYYADGPEKLEWPGYDAIAQTRDAEQYLRDHAKAAKPFLLFLAWGPPHSPYQTAPPEYRAKYHAEEIALRPNVPPAMADKARIALAGYYAHCTALDDCVGEIIQTLEQSGLTGNTLLIFSADHGDLLGSHSAYNKQQPYDESIRVPLLMHWPVGFGTAGRRLGAPINSEDLMPTLLGLCRIRIPKSVEGIDYSHYLRGGKDPSDGATVISCAAPFGQWRRKDGGREFRGVRTQRYTYVRDLHGPWLLFDNLSDPYQTNNLANLPEHASLQTRLNSQLSRKLKQAGDKFLPAADYVRQWHYMVDASGTVPYED